MIGYDTNNMHFASYDWRLSFGNLEVRDGYFSHLKSTIELSKKKSGLKTVVVTHSMGSSMFPYFLKWVESSKGGDGGKRWVNDNIESFVNIGGPLMGVPKAVTSMMSGETRDTMSLGSFGAYVLEKFFSRRERTKLMRNWLGGASMLPKGGDTVWGSKDAAPDDEENEKFSSFGNMISFVPHPEGINENSTETPSGPQDPLIRNYTVSNSIDLLLNSADETFNRHLHANYSYGITSDKKQLKKNDDDPTKWSNPLESRLPNGEFISYLYIRLVQYVNFRFLAPDMKIYCFYGVGTSTERSYYYAVADEELEEDCLENANSSGCTHEHKHEHMPEAAESTAEPPLHIKHPSLVREKKCSATKKESKLIYI